MTPAEPGLREAAARLADAVRYNLVAGVRLHSGKISDKDFDATTSEVIDSLQAYDAAAAAPQPVWDGKIRGNPALIDHTGGHSAAAQPALDVEFLRSERFQSALQAVFDAPGEWGPAQGYYRKYLDSFTDALIERLEEIAHG